MTHVFFTDRDLGNAFADRLKAAGLSVEKHSTHFRPDCPDEEWLAVVGRRGWVALTHDARIRYKPNELAAVVRNHVRLLVIVGKAPLGDLADSFIRTRTRVQAFLERTAPPFIAKVYRPAPAETVRNPEAAGRVERWYPE